MKWKTTAFGKTTQFTGAQHGLRIGKAWEGWTSPFDNKNKMVGKLTLCIGQLNEIRLETSTDDGGGKDITRK